MSIVFESSYDQVFDTQRYFRLVMDAMARPGKIQQLPGLRFDPPPGLNPYAVGIAITLMDNETTFSLLPDRQFWREYLRLNTGSRPVELGQAEFVLVEGGLDLAEMASLNRGSLQFPERSTYLILMVEGITEDEGSGLSLQIQGPGIRHKRRVNLTGLMGINLLRLMVLNREFPLGIEAIIVDRNGRLICLPRSSRFRWKEAD
ncbi:MAG: phosphonate C-P lyase system protein PhnH [Firmicutes bacterium]|nr:phosphonate C-P lyase system protein PhnH [Bacillota bacterium]